MLWWLCAPEKNSAPPGRRPWWAVSAPHWGLRGVWITVSLELAFRGIIYMLRLAFHRWEDTMKKSAG